MPELVTNGIKPCRTSLQNYDKIHNEIRNIFIAKNADYGDSFKLSIYEFGIMAGIVRINDKINRLKSLMKSDALVNESIKDTLLDLANYAIMTAGEMEEMK